MDASYSDDAEFLEAFDAFAQAVRRARGAPVQTRGSSLTLSQYGLLQPLQYEPVARVRDLAEQAGITPSTATRILDALERRDLVRRTRSSVDRRSVAVSLTEAGRRQLCEQDEWIRSQERAFCMQLPAEEREFAPELLRRLASFITDLAAGPEAEPEREVAIASHP
jgi:DNA-binding MarR family transcriptional regulator